MRVCGEGGGEGNYSVPENTKKKDERRGRERPGIKLGRRGSLLEEVIRKMRRKLV